MNATTLPPSETIRYRMRSCRDELAALKKLLRAAEAVEAADSARQQRQAVPKLRGGRHAR